MNPTPEIRLLDPAQYRRTPWKNGGGTTIDIADAYRPGAQPGGWSGMIWRLGRTRISVPAPFSDLSGCDRILAPLTGAGLVLRVEGGDALDASAPLRPVRFPGEWAITSELEAGPVEVLNLMGDRREVELDLQFLEPGQEVTIEAGEHAVYAPLGPAEIRVGSREVSLGAEWAAQFGVAAPLRTASQSGLVALASIRTLHPSR